MVEDSSEENLLQLNISKTMYGLIIENVLGYLRSHFHPKRYQEIKTLAKFPFEEVHKITHVIFIFRLIPYFRSKVDIDKLYPEGHIAKLVKKASQVLQITEQEILEGVGVYFVTITKHLVSRCIHFVSIQ
jgi:F420-0:gamma-glutamyl ligase-like protein